MKSTISQLRAAVLIASASGLVAGLMTGPMRPPAPGTPASGRGVPSVGPLVALGPQLGSASLLPTTSQCRQLFGFPCYQPAQLARAYDLESLHSRGVDGRGSTIALVDPFGSPTIAEDLRAFDRKFGLPDPPSFRVIQPVGAVAPFDPADPARLIWAGEATLDVEWSHAVAPGASIVLVETPVAETEGVQGFPEIVAAENYVIDHDLADVISQSFGATEQTFPSPSDVLALRSAFENAARHRVTVLAAAGDTGATAPESDQADLSTTAVVLWPSSDPLVTSVGGTRLQIDDGGNRLAPDAVWNDQLGVTGGGVSSIFPRPSFQARQRRVTGDHRGTPDVSINADPVFTFTSYPPNGPGFQLAWGTSLSAPLFAGIVAMADQLAGRRLGLINSALYHSRPGGLVDVTVGDNSFGPFTNSDGQAHTVTGYQATPGYVLASGLGTVDAGLLVPALAHRSHDPGGAP